MKEKLEQKKTSLLKEKDELKARAKASTDVAEVRSLSERIEKIDADIKDIDEMIKYLDEQRSQEVPDNATLVNGNIVNGRIVGSYRSEKSVDGESMEKREAFRAYVLKGEVRDAITVGNNGVAIPYTVMNEVINTVRKRYGNLYNKCRRTSVQGGVQYNTAELSATATWINESTASEEQKLGEFAKIIFAYHTLEIKVATSFLANLTSISAFEGEIARAIAIAYLEAMDKAIVKGTGAGQPLGILNDPRITNVVEMSAADIGNWTKWLKDFFAKRPLGYRNGQFIFPLGTIDAHLRTMADANNQPIYREATGLVVVDGDVMDPRAYFFGHETSIVEPDVIADFDTANVGDVVGVFWQPEEYAINENFAFTMRRYFDERTNQWIDKALAVTDGKVLNPKGFVLIKKKA